MTAAPSVTVAVGEPLLPLPAPIARLGDVACSWLTNRWVPGIVPLRLRPDGPVFARITGGRTQVEIPVGALASGMADVSSGGLALTGYVDRPKVALFAAKEFPMNGVVYPMARQRLSWVEGFADGVSVTMVAPVEVVVKAPPLLAKRRCTDVSLDLGSPLDLPRAALGAARGASMTLRAGPPVEVWSDPSVPAEIRLVVGSGMLAESFATSGLYMRVGIKVAGVLVAGWIKSDRLRSTSGGGSLSTLGGRSRMVDAVRPGLYSVTCEADVPLVVEAEGERATVGYALRGTAMAVLDDKEPFWRIATTNRDLHVSPEVLLLARASELRKCTKTSAAAP